MAIVATALFAVLIGLTGGLRIAIQYRRTGSTGFHGVQGRPGSAEWVAGCLFAVALAGAPLAGVLALLGVLEPIAVLDLSALHAIGLGLACAGILLVFYSQMAMGDSWRIGVDESERTTLVTDGPFGVVRNPIYAAIIPTAIGFAMMVPSALALIDLAVLGAALELQVRIVEEPNLIRAHGQEYRAYASRVGRFVPGIGRLSVAKSL
jgi:protein-S-isoprenylcysteine O-methyltransferase Ste14